MAERVFHTQLSRDGLREHTKNHAYNPRCTAVFGLAVCAGRVCTKLRAGPLCRSSVLIGPLWSFGRPLLPFKNATKTRRGAARLSLPASRLQRVGVEVGVGVRVRSGVGLVWAELQG